MAQVQSGDTVSIHYTGTLADGSTFDSSDGRDPLEFVVGSGQIIPGLDKSIPGMEVGDKKVVEIPYAEAYGESNPENRQSVHPPRTNPCGHPVGNGPDVADAITRRAACDACDCG